MSEARKPKEVPRHESIKRAVVSEVLTDGRLVEMVYDSHRQQTRLCIAKDGIWEYQSSVYVAGREYRPYSPDNNLLRNKVVLFPSEAVDYDSEEALLADIQRFVHRHVVVSPLFEKVASYYVLLSWLFDIFSELPYLRAIGDFGTGKTRFLLTVGSVCYKPIFASGASSASPLFRMLEAFRGTLIIDESDFRWSSEQAEIVKILNNGNARGFPVLRSELDGKQEYNPKAFPVFGPKILAARGNFDDPALESRFLTEMMGQELLRADIPINLPRAFDDEAQRLRNQLLCFRLRNRHRRSLKPNFIGDNIEPRLRQVLTPLLSLVEEPSVRQDILSLAERYDRDLRLERGLRTEAQVLEVIHEIAARTQEPVSIKAITERFTARFGADYERPVASRWIGYLVRKKLGLTTQKHRGSYSLALGQKHKLARLYERFGVGSAGGDMGDVGDVA